MYDSKDEYTKEEWLDITKTYRENKRKREIEPERLQENEKRTRDRSSSRTTKENEKRQ